MLVYKTRNIGLNMTSYDFLIIFTTMPEDRINIFIYFPEKNCVRFHSDEINVIFVYIKMMILTDNLALQTIQSTALCSVAKSTVRCKNVS